MICHTTAYIQYIQADVCLFMYLNCIIKRPKPINICCSIVNGWYRFSYNFNVISCNSLLYIEWYYVVLCINNGYPMQNSIILCCNSFKTFSIIIYFSISKIESKYLLNLYYTNLQTNNNLEIKCLYILYIIMIIMQCIYKKAIIQKLKI